MSKSCRMLRSSSQVSDDRISDLPDHIIQHILSFMDTKDAIKTCLLSKRWESLWTFVPALIFRCQSHDEVRRRWFTCFVEKALMKHASPKTQKFLLQFKFYLFTREQVESWLQYAVNHEVEELCLELNTPDHDWLHSWPKCLYTVYSLTKLTLHSFCLKGGLKGFHCTSLKFLSVTHSTVDIDTLGSILEGSPLIECLTLQRCRLHSGDLRIFDASRTSLKRLVMDEMFRGDNQPIDISAPNLSSLTIVMEEMYEKFNLVDVSSLVEANVDFSLSFSSYSNDTEMLKDHIRVLDHVKKLKVGIWCILSKVLQVKFPPATRKIAEVDIISTTSYFPGLSALLYSLPDLEQLTINLMPSNYHPFRPMEFIVKQGLRLPILICGLKSVKITGFVPGSCSNSEMFVFELVKYLLENANKLQELIIDVGVETSPSATPKTFGKLYGITQKLLSYPRASADAVIMFGSHQQWFHMSSKH